MRKKIIIGIGTLAVIASLMMPVMKEEKTVVGIVEPKTTTNTNSSWNYVPRPRTIYDTKVVVDYYQTGARTFSILVGTMLLAWIVPERKSNPSIDS